MTNERKAHICKHRIERDQIHFERTLRQELRAVPCGAILHNCLMGQIGISLRKQKLMEGFIFKA